MVRPTLPDHVGRMPQDPGYGNPCDPMEEATRIRLAYENVERWQRTSGGSFSGGVTMSQGEGRTYHVPIGDPEIAAKVSSRPISQSKGSAWLVNLIKGVFR